MSFDHFFNTTTGGHTPFDYQRRLACGPREDGELEADWLSKGIRASINAIASNP